MKSTNPAQTTSSLAGLFAAIMCTGVWLSFGMFILALQGGVA
jgi:hypothetical protein